MGVELEFDYESMICQVKSRGSQLENAEWPLAK